MADGIPRRIKPTAATSNVTPAFQKNPFRVITPEQIFRKLRVSNAVLGKWACDMGFSTARKLGFVAWAAMGAINQQHGFLSLFSVI
jgi:hypothetical protein